MLDPLSILAHVIFYLVCYGISSLIVGSQAILVVLLIGMIEVALAYWSYRSTQKPK